MHIKPPAMKTSQQLVATSHLCPHGVAAAHRHLDSPPTLRWSGVHQKTVTSAPTP
jgi:hypothetical protein